MIYEWIQWKVYDVPSIALKFLKQIREKKSFYAAGLNGAAIMAD